MQGLCGMRLWEAAGILIVTSSGYGFRVLAPWFAVSTVTILPC